MTCPNCGTTTEALKRALGRERENVTALKQRLKRQGEELEELRAFKKHLETVYSERGSLP